MTIRLRQNGFGGWILIPPDAEYLAWSGSRWVPIDERGFPAGDTQVSNLNSRVAAVEYARQFGFEVEA